MKILYLDCGMGAAGDMLTAALMELIPDADAFLQEMNALGLPGVCIKREPSVKCGITGSHISVTVHGEEEESLDYHEHHHGHGHHHNHEHECHHEHDHYHGHEHEHHHGNEHEHHHEYGHGHPHSGGHSHAAHHHSSLQDIEHIVKHLPVPQPVREDILAVYGLIADAESKAHGVPVTEIHFHEVGTMDAVADIAAVCLLMSRIAPDKVVASPVHVGSGHVHCAHGVLPVPAPATSHILRDVPVFGGGIKGELCTPTGAALLRHFVTSFGDMPLMRVQSIGYGMGKKDFGTANCLRAMLGEAEDKTGMILELSCNVDDMTAEQIGFAMERFFEGGALDVYTIPIGMKNSRPGTLIRVMCSAQNRETLLRLMFRHTTTIGVREAEFRRYTMDRTTEIVQTPYGELRRKVSSGYGVTRTKYEYRDLARAAMEHGMSLDALRTALESK